uniref:AB hydrolase-1 domain-containing protein n=1 Tax=Heterorhabditis bacteriophora TaxID=37862 RepID=A0A1I7X7L4_HETBA
MVLVESPSLLDRADLTRPIPDNVRKLAELVEINEKRVQVRVRIVIIYLFIVLYTVIVVCASMSAQYVLPLLARDVFVCMVGVAPSNTHEIGQPSAYKTPILVVWGEWNRMHGSKAIIMKGDRDTSLGPTAAANLRPLPNSRLQKIPSAGHACYLNNPRAFQEVCVNFFELIRNYHSL